MASQSKKKLNPNEKAFYGRYKNEGRHYKNKVKKLKNHLKAQPNDKIASETLISLVKSGVSVYNRNKRANKPNETFQKKIKRISTFTASLGQGNIEQLKPKIKEKNEKI